MPTNLIEVLLKASDIHFIVDVLEVYINDGETSLYHKNKAIELRDRLLG